jgi:beta-lactamase superfamily II metal-dependent hydrolase
MDLKIFDVEHGACALITCDNNTRIMIDCGHNASTGWYPGTYLRQQGIGRIEMLTVSNYDEDHVTGIRNLTDNVVLASLTRNPTVSAAAIRHLKSEDGMGNGIAHLTNCIEKLFTGPSTMGSVFYLGLVL